MALQLTYCVCSSSSTLVLGPTWTIVFCVFNCQSIKTMMLAGITNASDFVMSLTSIVTMDYLIPLMHFKRLSEITRNVGLRKTIRYLIILSLDMVSSFLARKQLTIWELAIYPIISLRKSLMSIHGLHPP